MCMESYCCPNVIFSNNISGFITKPSLEEVDIISEFLVGFMQDYI